MFCGGGYANRSLAGYRILLLFVVIVLIVGVCSILWGKPLQNLAYQWPFGETEERERQFPCVKQLVLIKDNKYMG